MGIIDNSYSPFYAPEQAMAMRITGQLCISKVIEEYWLNDVEIISVNTDSVTLKIPRYKLYLLDEVRDKIQKELNLTLEDTQYDFIKYTSVNDYIGKTNKGKVKVKGEFIFEKTLDASNEFLVIPYAIKEYFVNNIPVEETIKNHKNIYDFCCCKKISKTYELYYMQRKVQQLNRFFVSKKGAYLYKKKKTKTTYEHVFKEAGVILLNDTTDKLPSELPIDYQFYIRKSNQLISKFNKTQMSLF